MGTRSSADGREKVIYQYTLLKKIRPSPSLLIPHAAAPALWLAAASWAHGSGAPILAAAVSFLAFHLLYRVLSAALLWRDRTRSHLAGRHRWVLRGWPWIGYLPSGGFPFRPYLAMRLHMLAVGGLVTLAAAPWLSPWIAMTAGFTHLWCIFPQLFAALRMSPAAASDSIITFQRCEILLQEP